MWVEGFTGNTPIEGGRNTKVIKAAQMFLSFRKCVDEIESRFHVKVLRVKSDDETMFKGVFHWYFVKPSISGPLKTKVRIVERFKRTLKNILKKLINKYNLNEKAWLKLHSMRNIWVAC